MLAPATAAPLRRAADGSLISVREEIRVLLWVGVLLISTGAGLLIKENLDRIGPVAIAVALGLGAAGCLLWVRRRAPAFGWGETGEGDLVRDAALLLGALLAAADLAFIEVKFTPLGAEWRWHLLIVAAFYAALALRFDSKSLFSLALTSFAAWRGVAIVTVAVPWGPLGRDDRLLVEALICGVLFLALGKLLERTRRKPHFEPTAAWLGWLLILGALAVRLGVDDGRVAVALSLIACGLLLAWLAWYERAIGRHALGIGAAAYGVGGLIVHFVDLTHGGDVLFTFLVVVLAAAVVFLVLRAQRALRRTA